MLGLSVSVAFAESLDEKRKKAEPAEKMELRKKAEAGHESRFCGHLSDESPTTPTSACGPTTTSWVRPWSLNDSADVKASERVADVYLDTSPFSGNISVVNPLELDLPFVAQKGATYRSRIAAALLRELDLPELITTDKVAYITLAHRLGTDATYRRQLNERILAAIALRPKFINAQGYARGLSPLLESLARVR